MHSRSFLPVFEQQSTRKVSAAEKFESDIQRRSDTQPHRRDCWCLCNDVMAGVKIYASLGCF